MSKYIFRKLILFLLYAFYFFAGRFFSKKPEIFVLMYHSISNSPWFFSVSPSIFEKQMKYLKENYNLVSLSDIIDFIGGTKNLSHRSVAVTFDDGYQDFYKNALRIIKKHEIPVTLFVLAGRVDRKEFGNEFELLNWTEISDISKNEPLVEIGSHALTHKKLTRISKEEMKNEINLSGVIIGEKIGGKVDFFAYPKGAFNQYVVEALKRSGYNGAVTAEQKLVDFNGNKFMIPRIQIDSAIDFFSFKVKLTRVTNWYNWFWRKFYG